MGIKKWWQDLTGQTRTEISRRIDEAAQTDKLDLRYLGLTEVPPEVWQLTNLQRLNLWGNQLKTIPQEIGQLTNLQEFNLDDNWLTAIPPEIGQLTNLQTFILCNNKLRAVPPEIGQLTNLQWLDLCNNQITAVPLELCQLTQLEVLGLFNNPLPIPIGILFDSDNPTRILDYVRQIHTSKTAQTQEIIPTKPELVPPQISDKPKPNRIELRRNLTELFSLEELRLLCFELNIIFDDLEGTTISGKSVSLIEKMERNGRLTELMLLVQQHRPRS